MKEYSRICAKVDLDAVEYNIETLKRNIQKDVSMMAVVKMDGYGHGAAPITEMLEEKEYIWGYAVATAEEAVLLRNRGIKKPVLVLGCVFPGQREALIKRDIQMTVYTKEMAEEISILAGQLGKKAYIHIKLDTGMSRLGFLVQEESIEAIAEINRMPGLIMEGLYTHFSKADELDKSFTLRQLDSFLYMKHALEERGIAFRFYHCSNSAGIIDMKETNMNLVRAGIAAYGLYPSGEVKKERVLLKPAMELISHVTHVKWVEPGTPVSYGGTFITDRETKIATIPVGYGDGYPRSLSGKGYVLIHGKKAPILGRICMDQFMVNVTEIPNVSFGDKVTLVGCDGGERLPVEVLSDLSGKFNYEFICSLGKRIPRIFFRHGKMTEQMDYFE